MTSLPQVLHEAANSRALEITLEVGQAPMIRTEAGAVSVGVALGESDLFDALAQVLGPDQQAELAVGNVVEFHVDVDAGRWTLIGEPSVEGIVVRGRLQGGRSPAIETGTPLDLPPLAPFEPDRREEIPNTAPSPLFRRAQRRTQSDLVVSGESAAEPTTNGATPNAVPTGAVEDESPPWLVRSGDPEPTQPAAVDFELRPPTAETSTGDEAAPSPAAEVESDVRLIPDDPRPLDRDAEPQHEAGPAEDAETIDLAPKRSASGFAGRARAAAAGPMTRADLDDGNDTPPVAAASSTTAALVGGTLCWASDREAAERVAATGSTGAFRLIEDDAFEESTLAGARRPPGGTYLVRLEDPSRALGWILRRLEEGARIVVETRARCARGARRILLGTAASELAARWLDAHPQFWLEQCEGRWVVEPLQAARTSRVGS